MDQFCIVSYILSDFLFNLLAYIVWNVLLLIFREILPLPSIEMFQKIVDFIQKTIMSDVRDSIWNATSKSILPVTVSISEFYMD